VAADPPRRPPFELQVRTGPSPHTHLGGPAAADPDLLLAFAACRRAGVAVAGPGPAEVFADPPRAWLLDRVAAELRWALGHGSVASRVLTACRAWRYLEDDVLGAKVDSARWARLRLADAGSSGAADLVDEAVAAQLGLAPMPVAPADRRLARELVAGVLDRFREGSA
jgi:hypothetical protein